MKANAEIVKRFARETGLKVGAIYSRLSGCLLDPDPKVRELAITELKDRLESAAEIGAIGVIFVPIFGAARLPDLRPLFASVSELEGELLVGLLKEIAKEAESLRTTLILEPLNKQETHFINTLPQAVRICDRVGSGALKIVADVYHMNLEGEDLVRAITEAAPYIAHVHLSNSDRTIPTPEDIDFGSILTALDSIHYKGCAALECKAPENSEALGHSAKFLKGFLK